MKKKESLEVCFSIAAAFCALAEAKIFAEYQALCKCTPDTESLRSSFTTNARSIGKLDEYNKIIVQRSSGAKILTDIRLTDGAALEKISAVSEQTA